MPSLDLALRSLCDAAGCPLVSNMPPDKGVLWREPPARKRSAWARMERGGFRPHGELASSAGQVVVGYMDDPQAFNVERLMVRPWLDGVMGFRRESRADKLVKNVLMALA